MGNRAVLTTKENFVNNGIGIYLHWNGGRDSVEAFLKYCELQQFRKPEEDNYGWASLCMIITNFLGYDGNSVGIDKISNLDCDNGDNGVYIIKDWKIVDRKFFSGKEQAVYTMDKMLDAINIAQPKTVQLSSEKLNSNYVPTSELKIGDTVIIKDGRGGSCQCVIANMGFDMYVNGTNVNGLPFIKRFPSSPSCPDYMNINNYLTSDKYIRV